MPHQQAAGERIAPSLPDRGLLTHGGDELLEKGRISLLPRKFQSDAAWGDVLDGCGRHEHLGGGFAGGTSNGTRQRSAGSERSWCELHFRWTSRTRIGGLACPMVRAT